MVMTKQCKGSLLGMSLNHVCYVYSVVENTVYVTTPPMNVTSRHLAIELEMIDSSRIATNRTFEYRNNPVFSEIRPRDHIYE